MSTPMMSPIMLKYVSKLGLLSRFWHIAQMGLILPRWGLILPRIPPPTPVPYSTVTHPFQGYVHTQNTPNPTPEHSFSWPELESGQNEPNVWATLTPTGQNV